LKRIRLFAVAAVAVASLGVGAVPASAKPVCHPDTICPDCSSVEIVNTLWRKLFGYDPECA
jgi:hypothetical protein